MVDKVRILAVNPGSTSTKIAVYENEECIFSESAHLCVEELEKHKGSLKEQCMYRAEGVEKTLREARIDPASFDVVVGRGGYVPGMKAGAYQVEGVLLDYMYHVPAPWHASDFGGIVAHYFAERSGCQAYIYDGPGVDEMIDMARITGFKGVYRQGGGHVLNQRACAIKYAKEVGKPLESLRLIVAHLGGGCSFNAFENGKMIDNFSDMEGTYAPERSGPLSPSLLIRLYADSGMTKQEMMSLIRGKGGLVALLGTNDAREVEKMIDAGDEKAKIVYDGMCYRIAKSIGGLVAAPLKGRVDAVILTGSLAYSERLTNFVTDYIRPLAGEIVIYPGEKEMESLAYGGLRVYRGEEQVRVLEKSDLEKKFSI